MAHAKDTKYQEFYELIVNSKIGDYPKQYTLNRGLVKLGFSLSDLETFNYDTLKSSWVSKTAIPTEEEIKTAAIAQIETDISMQYQGDRANAYPQIGEQLDKLYKDIVAGTVTTSGAFATAIKAVKDKYPKP
tara:strand:- start:57 stop:452 length:396 start_codon:yes stop_codon:yes gene_type:complete